MVKRESCPSKIGPINLGTKQTGAPSAGNPHAGCDVAGAGNGFTGWLLRHSQRKRGATDRPDLRNTAPVLDPTGQCLQMSLDNAVRFVTRLMGDHGHSGSDLRTACKVGFAVSWRSPGRFYRELSTLHSEPVEPKTEVSWWRISGHSNFSLLQHIRDRSQRTNRM